MQIKEIQDVHELQQELANKKVLGIDETGVGDYFTPLVAAVAVVSEENVQKLIDLGVKDSKKLSDSKIQQLASIIKENELAKFKVAHIGPKGYNNMTKKNNANEIKTFVHLKALKEAKFTIKTNDFDCVLIDQYSTENAIKGYLEKWFDPSMKWAGFRKINKPIYLTYQAESKHISVAVASIMARDFLINKMKEYNALYGVELPLGASEAVKQFSRDFIEKNTSNEKEKAILMNEMMKNFKLED
ncbi:RIBONUCLEASE HII (RNASE HII) [Mycoplasmopsis pulmonis]|uniref:Ribonuclease n=1 Tax=Mycoplasmopsis pulmonis (strain UAB CTIP) TaxID=272635 RepID=Q98QR1_MYCPU|nr:ribonuclease HIII [Mycoplasmopsis pulmonis]CAC13473.1 RIBONUCLEASE HII (RNASE HII) [Mycoplasmopsis pulmonis]VEU68063.1 ribonuclease HII [Mycoplasmopsis pulmonis]